MSSALPWMPLHVADYLRDTNHLNAAEHGAYLLLIMEYWTKGGLPSDERLIARIARMSPDEWKESRDILAAFFDPGWKHKRIEKELEEAREKYGRRSGAGKAAAEARWAQKRECETDAKRIAPANRPAPQPPPQEPKGSNKGNGGGGYAREPSAPLYTERELDGFRKAFDRIDVDAIVSELSDWCDLKRIYDPIRRKSATFNALRNRQADAQKAADHPLFQTGPPVTASAELIATLGRRRRGAA